MVVLLQPLLSEIMWFEPAGIMTGCGRPHAARALPVYYPAYPHPVARCGCSLPSPLQWRQRLHTCVVQARCVYTCTGK
jgi:hypothetical protein